MDEQGRNIVSLHISKPPCCINIFFSYLREVKCELIRKCSFVTFSKARNQTSQNFSELFEKKTQTTSRCPFHQRSFIFKNEQSMVSRNCKEKSTIAC